MPRIYQLSLTGLRLIYKIRHHRGHGVHSPFVFRFINRVIEEKSPFYLYKDISEHIYSKTEGEESLNKMHFLSFRLVNFFNATRILEIGSGIGINTIAITAPSSKTECICVENSKEKREYAKKIYDGWNRKITLFNDGLPSLDKKQDCIFIDLNNYTIIPDNFLTYLSNNSHEKTFIVVNNIRTSKTNYKIWQRIANIEERTALTDLFNLGIIFFDKQLYRWDYKLSF